MDQENTLNPETYQTGLAVIRRRRWFSWGMVLIYMPASLMTLQLTQSYKLMGFLFLAWLILLCIAVAMLASSKCPRCGNSFHMRNSTISFFGKCRHCGLANR